MTYANKFKFLKSASAALAFIVALTFTVPHSDASSIKGGHSHGSAGSAGGAGAGGGGGRPGDNSKGNQDNYHCHGFWKRRCHFGDRRHKMRDEIGKHRGKHGSRAQGWGNWGSGACGKGQGSCAASSGSGYRGLASALGQSASTLTQQAKSLRNDQAEIVDSSLNEEPGRDNPDARQFDQSTRSGASRRSDFTNATDPIVQEQVEEYNAMADTIDELEAEAEKYREQEKEMNELAQKSENNADNLVSSQKGVSGANAPSANGGAQNSTIAKSDEAEALTYAPNGTRELNSDISTKTAESESAANAKLLAKDTKTALSSSALPGAAAGSSVSTKGNLRETLRERLRNSSGSSSSADAEYSRGAGEMHSPGQGRSLASGKSGSGSGKEERPTIDSANTEESIGAFNQQLGGGDIGLAGSETDASVKAMLNEFGLSKEGNREPASLNSAEIGTKDGPSLFERCRATHKRCAKNGCVTQASGERAGG